MGYKTVKASWLIQGFQKMVDEGWRYVPNAARAGEVDCSGAFEYWYKQAGSYCPHGSNSMYRTHSKIKGRIGEIELKPGMPVYRHKNDGGEPDKYKSDGLGNFNHVGLYIGNGKCIEAKGEQYGVVISDISSWEYTSQLKYTVYDVEEGSSSDADVISGADAPVDDPAEQYSFPIAAHVSTPQGGSLNLRKKPSTSSDSTIMKRIPNDTQLTLTDSKPGWYRTTYDCVGGWVNADFIEINAPTFDRIVHLEIHSEEEYAALINYVIIHDIDFTVEGGDD